MRFWGGNIAMTGKIIDINASHALISFQDGNTKYVSITCIPANSKIGDKVHISPNSPPVLNDKLTNIYPINIL